jgi:hypothetical protein
MKRTLIFEGSRAPAVEWSIAAVITQRAIVELRSMINLPMGHAGRVLQPFEMGDGQRVSL